MYKRIYFFAGLLFLLLPLQSQEDAFSSDSAEIPETPPAPPVPRVPEIPQIPGVYGVVPADIPQNPFESRLPGLQNQGGIDPQVPALPRQQPQQQMRPAVRAASPFQPKIEELPDAEKTETLPRPESEKSSESPEDFSANIRETQNAEQPQNIDFGTNTENLAQPIAPALEPALPPINGLNNMDSPVVPGPTQAGQAGADAPAKGSAEAPQARNMLRDAAEAEAARPPEVPEAPKIPGALREAPNGQNGPQKVPEKAPQKQAITEPLEVSAEPASKLLEESVPHRGGPNEQVNLSKTILLGEAFPLSLYGLIWTYIPSLSEAPARPKFERKLEEQSTSFLFDLDQPGRYLLAFSRQIPSTGDLEYYHAEILVEEKQPAVVSGARNVPLLTEESAGGTERRITGQVRSGVRRLLQNGELQAAYQTLQNWPERERGDVYQVAAQYFLDADMNAQAVDMWQRNVGLDGDLQDKAVVGITNALLRSDDEQRLLDWLPRLVEQAKKQPGAILAEDFAKVYQVLSKSAALEGQNPENMLDFYQVYLTLYPGENSPEILYKMASFFEKPGSRQDLRRARQLYRNIQRQYPVDEYEQKASERLNYLNRHFFFVR